MIKIVDLCPVCGGKGKFLTQKCPSCNGEGGQYFRYNSSLSLLFERNREKLSEQEIMVFELFRNGYSAKEISKNLDLKKSQISVVMHNIEKKLNN